MRLSLAIQVWNGAGDWAECWRSVIANLDLFENVFVSISCSPSQENDITVVKSCDSSKIHLLTHDDCMTAVEHGRKFDEWIASFKLTGHLFLLCHDDILLRNGLLQLIGKKLDDTDAVFGPWEFFSSDQDVRELKVKQFYRSDGMPWDKETFLFLLEQQLYALNISGIVIPAEVYNNRYFPWHLCVYGSRSECLHLCSPLIKQIHQLSVPAVKIRIRGNSEGALMDVASNQFDTLLYLNLAWSVVTGSRARGFILRGIGSLMKVNFVSGIKFMIKGQWRLWRNNYLSLGMVLKIWCCFLFLTSSKVVFRIAHVLKLSVNI